MGVRLEAEAPVNAVDDTGFDLCDHCHEVVGPSHVCTDNIRAARELALNVMTPKLRRWGWAWVSFILGAGARPVVPRGLVHEARGLELRIAALGLVDPAGLVMGVDLLRLRRRPGTKRRPPKGRMPEELRRHLVDRRNHAAGGFR